jgi:hypothetical protein
LIDVLPAPGPAPGLEAKLATFGRFVGSWDIDWSGFAPDGSRLTARGEVHFGWVLEGRAIQDVWIFPARDLRAQPLPPQAEYGTTVRMYHPATDTWKVCWAGPQGGAFTTLLGRPSGNEIVLETETPEGHPMKWIFSKIEPFDRPSTFEWRREVSRDAGRTWTREIEMKMRRR